MHASTATQHAIKIGTMLNRHQFQQAAKKFRAGSISLSQFTDQVFAKPKKQMSGESAGGSAVHFPQRPADAHKGDFGRLVFVGGSLNMPGAIALSALAALKSGAGTATVVCPESAQPIVAGFSPCVMTAPVAAESGCFAVDAAEQTIQICEQADVVALGPGMGRSEAGQKLCCELYRRLPIPLVVDADGLNNIADAELDLSEHAGQRVLTPHPGEFQRLFGVSANHRVQAIEAANTFAEESGFVVILKGAGTAITDGSRRTINQTGNSSLATAGSGDVLSGLIASLVGQKSPVWDACCTAVHLHGLAADLFIQKKPAASLTATDLIEMIPAAIARIEQQAGK